MRRSLVALIACLVVVIAIAGFLLYYHQVRYSGAGSETTSPTITVSTTNPLSLSEKAEHAVTKLCRGAKNNVLLIVYLKHEPESNFVKTIARFLESFIRSRSGNLVAVNLTPCVVALEDLEKAGIELGDLRKNIYPLLAIVSREASKLVFLRNMSVDIEGIMFFNKYVLRGLYSQISVIGDRVPIETIIEPHTDPEDTPIIGNKNARFYVYIYEDAYCPYCAIFYNETLPELEKLIENGTVALVLKNFIVHEHVKEFHVYIEAAYMETQNARGALEVMYSIYLKLLKILRSGEEEDIEKVIDMDLVKKLVREYMGVAIDSTQLLEKAREVVDEDTREAVNYGIGGTPGFVIWDREKGYGIVFAGYRPPDAFLEILRFMQG